MDDQNLLNTLLIKEFTDTSAAPPEGTRNKKSSYIKRNNSSNIQQTMAHPKSSQRRLRKKLKEKQKESQPDTHNEEEQVETHENALGDPNQFLQLYLDEDVQETKQQIQASSLKLHESIRLMEVNFCTLTNPNDSRLKRNKELSHLGTNLVACSAAARQVLAFLSSRNEKLEAVARDLVTERHFSINAQSAKQVSESKAEHCNRVIAAKDSFISEQEELIEKYSEQLRQSEIAMDFVLEQKHDLQRQVEAQEDQLDTLRQSLRETKRQLELKTNLLEHKSRETKLLNQQMSSKSITGARQKKAVASASVQDLLREKDEEIKLLRMMLESSRLEKASKSNENHIMRRKLNAIATHLPAV